MVKTQREARKLFYGKLEERAQAEHGKAFDKLHWRTKPKVWAATLGDLIAFGDLPVGTDPEKQVWPGIPSYLPRATDFTDLPVKPRPDPRYGMGDHDTLCPLCKGHGGWNLDVDAYGPGKHFQASCSQCNGWGWVHPENAKCIHEWKEIGQDECRLRGIGHYGSCWHVYACTKCDATTAADSSD